MISAEDSIKVAETKTVLVKCMGTTSHFTEMY